MIRVLVVDDMPSVRVLLRAQLRTSADVEIVAEANDGVDGVARAAAVQPDVILLDERMPLANGSEVLSRMRAASPRSRIILLSSFVDEHLSAATATGDGPDALLEKGSPIERLLDLIALGPLYQDGLGPPVATL